MRDGLARTRAALGAGLDSLFGRSALDDALFDEMEEALIVADCGVETAHALVERVRDAARNRRIQDPAALRGLLKDALVELLAPLEREFDVSRAKPFVVMLAGVNGSGKTTSIGKLAHWLQRRGRSVLLAAGDTFRAAAREQLIE